MPLHSGDKLGPYEIQDSLGAGGMGEVYRARDTRLNRVVALKILPQNVSSDPALRQRFQREGRAISSLQHPHICVLHDVGCENGTDFLVMEYLSGQNLADRLHKGPLPIPEVLRIALEIADALSVAHRDGLVHRDLKPANIMLGTSGAKLMDFGLAKRSGAVARQSAAMGQTLSDVPSPLTAEHVVVGTLPYMAPEVLEGREADARSDVFSFGCLLYEMVTGERAFKGESGAAVSAAILRSDPTPVSQLRPEAPRALQQIITACLQKKPNDRWESMHDAFLELQWLRSAGDATALATRQHKSWLLPAMGGLAAVLAILLFVTFTRTSGHEPSPTLRASLNPPSGLSFSSYNFALSPDGQRLAFTTEAPDGKTTLWWRAMSSSTAQPLPQAEGPRNPFWSPDGRYIGFFSEGKLRTVDLSTGETRIVCSSFMLNGATWNQKNTIVFAPDISGALLRVDASGGTPVAVTKAGGKGSAQAHRWPFFLPDGDHFLFTIDWSAPNEQPGDGLYVSSLSKGAVKLLDADVHGNVEYSNGHLLYFQDHNIIARPFDLKTLEMTGPPVPFAQQLIDRHAAFSKASFSSSGSGMLIFQSNLDSAARLTWFDTSGRELEELPESGSSDPDISPDGKFLAVSANTEQSLGNIRLYDLNRHLVTFITSGREDGYPVWSPDSRSIYYVSQDGPKYAIVRVAVDHSRAPEVVLQGGKMIPNDITRDGQFMILMEFESGRAMLSVYSIAEHKRVARYPGAEAKFSPNGKFIANTDRTGELVLQPFPGPVAPVQISAGGGSQPRWSRDGRHLFYIAPNKNLMVVQIDPNGKQPPSAPKVFMPTRIVGTRFEFIQYAFSPDGSRVVINSIPKNGGGTLSIISDWAANTER